MVLTGSCPWPGPWSRSYGAHLQLQAREDPSPTAMAVPPTLILELSHFLRRTAKALRRKMLWFGSASLHDHCRVEGRGEEASADAPGRPSIRGARPLPPIGAGFRSFHPHSAGCGRVRLFRHRRRSRSRAACWSCCARAAIESRCRGWWGAGYRSISICMRRALSLFRAGSGCPSRRAIGPTSNPTFSRCRCLPSMQPAIASAMARASTTARSLAARVQERAGRGLCFQRPGICGTAA